MNGIRLEEKPHSRAIFNLKERLNETIWWFPFPALIAFGLVIVLGGHLLTDLNPRLGSKTDVLQLSSAPLADGSIWLGISLEGDTIVIVTSDRKRFRWPATNTKMSDLEELRSYLKEKTQAETYRSVRMLDTSSVRSKVVLAVDQKTKYFHIRPIIYALAEANISKYGFETRIVKDR